MKPLYWSRLLIAVKLHVVMACLIVGGCKDKGPSIFNPFGKPPLSQQTAAATAGEAATYEIMRAMAIGSFFPGVLCLIAGVVAGHFIPALKTPLTSIGTTLIIVGIGTAASSLMLDRYGGWAAGLILTALAGGLVMWLLNQWRDNRWRNRNAPLIEASKANGGMIPVEQVEQMLA